EIAEVVPNGNNDNNTYKQDWFELTNYGGSSVDISQWCMNDYTDAGVVPLNGGPVGSTGTTGTACVTGATGATGVTIAPRESIVIVEGDTTVPAKFRTDWDLDPNVQVINCGGCLGLKVSGDAVNLYAGRGDLVDSVDWTASPATASASLLNPDFQGLEPAAPAAGVGTPTTATAVTLTAMATSGQAG